MSSDSDSVLTGFSAGCIAAGLERCALARPGATASSIETSVYALLSRVREEPIVVDPRAFPAVLVDYTFVKGVIVGAFYDPSSFALLARGLDGLITGNATSAAELVATVLAVPPLVEKEANQGIKCGDKDWRVATRAALMPATEDLQSRSKLYGDLTAGVVATCARWRFDAKERYAGDFMGVKTKTPVLLIGNTWDPLTPLRSARNTSAGFEGSVVLEQRGYGVRADSHPFVACG